MINVDDVGLNDIIPQFTTLACRNDIRQYQTKNRWMNHDIIFSAGICIKVW